MYNALIRNPINAVLAIAALFLVLTLIVGNHDETGEVAAESPATASEQGAARLATVRTRPEQPVATAPKRDYASGFTPEDQLVDQAQGSAPEPTFVSAEAAQSDEPAAKGDGSGDAKRRSRTETEEDTIGPKWDRADESSDET
jgi:hypothetical protein